MTAVKRTVFSDGRWSRTLQIPLGDIGKAFPTVLKQRFELAIRLGAAPLNSRRIAGTVITGDVHLNFFRGQKRRQNEYE
jgi:hypothetical protein